MSAARNYIRSIVASKFEDSESCDQFCEVLESFEGLQDVIEVLSQLIPERPVRFLCLYLAY